MRLGLEAGEHTQTLALELGIKGVPIAAEQLVKEDVTATLASLKDKSLQVCQIGAFGYNPLSTDKEKQAQQTDIVRRAIPLAAETGCPYIVICGGNYHPSGFGAGDARNFTDAALDELAQALAPMLDLAEQHGAKLTIEPYLKTAIYSPERFLALYDRLQSDALRINIDVTSLYAYWDLWDSADTVEHVCTALAGHYGLGHLKEVALEEGFHIHAGLAPIGTGITDWAEVLRLMAPHIPNDSWVILEHVLSLEEGRQSYAYLQDAADRAKVTLQ
jgi:sugar phosphate isomerase/epimerase